MRNKIIFIFLIIVLFSSCAGKKELIKQETNTEVKTDSLVKTHVDEKRKEEVRQKTENQTDTNKDSKEVQNDDMEIVIIKYDTEKPIDQSTGRPPVVSETTMRKTSSKSKQDNERVKTTGRESTEYKFDDRKTKDTSIQTEKEQTIKQSNKQKTTTPKTTSPRAIIITILIALLLGAFAAFKFKFWPFKK